MHSTTPGTSGAPLLLKKNHNEYEVVGVHLWGEYQRNAGILLKNLSLKA
jgi:V8-like Glu-specific endopeptidase